MEIKITKGKKPFGNYKAISVRALKEDQVVMVEFPNCISFKTNKPFIWIPTYDQLREIKKALDEIEELNKMEKQKL